MSKNQKVTLTFKDMKALRSMNMAQVAQIGAELLDANVTVDQLKEVIKAGKSPLKVALAICLLKAIQSGDITALNKITDFIVGKKQYSSPFRLFE